MIIVKLKGGLGNQMFQYAFGRFLSIKNKDITKFDTIGLEKNSQETYRKYSLGVFKISGSLASEDEIKKIKYPFGILSKGFRFVNAKVFRNFNISFNPKLLNLKNDIYLDGYFQSEEYFKTIRNILLDELVLNSELSPSALKFNEQIINSKNSVSLHVRRGDYVADRKINSIHGTCNLDYYNNAISLITEKIESPTFYIFSDDIEWVKENLSVNNAIFVSNREIKDYEELILMSKCKHNIIANSSFSWWGAWLNQNPNKIIIAPKQWTIKETSDKLGIIPKSWTQI